jgi:hypothetical protein
MSWHFLENYAVNGRPAVREAVLLERTSGCAWHVFALNSLSHPIITHRMMCGAWLHFGQCRQLAERS